MDIQITAGSALTPPPAGYKTLFINTEDGNLLSWMDSSGTITRFTDGDADCCACEIAKDYADAISCALKKGILTDIQVKSLMNLGFTITSNSTDDGAGNKTCTVTFGGNNIS